MKREVFKTKQGNFLLLDIHEDYLVKVHYNHLVISDTSNGLISKMNKLNNDPRGFIEVKENLGRASEITEEQAGYIVNKMYPDVYVQSTSVRQIFGYETAVYSYSSAKECLRELIEEKGMNNPYIFKIN